MRHSGSRTLQWGDRYAVSFCPGYGGDLEGTNSAIFSFVSMSRTSVVTDEVGSTEIFASNSEKSGSGHGSHVAASAMGGCGHGGYGYVRYRQRARANLVVKSNSRATHFRVVLV